MPTEVLALPSMTPVLRQLPKHLSHQWESPQGSVPRVLSPTPHTANTVLSPLHRAQRGVPGVHSDHGCAVGPAANPPSARSAQSPAPHWMSALLALLSLLSPLSLWQQALRGRHRPWRSGSSSLCWRPGKPQQHQHGLMSLSLLLKVTAWCVHVFHVRYIKYNTTMHCTFPRQPSCHFRLTHSLLRKNAALGIYKAFQLNGHKSQVSFKPNNHWP